MIMIVILMRMVVIMMLNDHRVALVPVPWMIMTQNAARARQKDDSRQS
jgi:hypothetical protein